MRVPSFERASFELKRALNFTLNANKRERKTVIPQAKAIVINDVLPPKLVIHFNVHITIFLFFF